MKSILKQVLTVVLLLSVPAVFAAEQADSKVAAAEVAEKATTGYTAKAKAGLLTARTYVAKKSKAAYNYAKDTRIAQWTFNSNDTKLKRAGKVALVGSLTAGALVATYFAAKKAYSFYCNKTQTTAKKLEVAQAALKKAEADLAKAEKATWLPTWLKNRRIESAKAAKAAAQARLDEVAPKAAPAPVAQNAAPVVLAPKGPSDAQRAELARLQAQVAGRRSIVPMGSKDAAIVAGQVAAAEAELAAYEAAIRA